MMRYDVSAVIAASPETTWSILADAPGYARWDNGVVRVEGTIAPGEKIKLVSEINPERAFAIKVTGYDPGRSMQWTGGMPLGLFKGVRTMTLTAQGDGHTAFEMQEVFSGPLLGVMSRSMPDLGPSFEQFAAGCKARAESHPG